jgi:hypothetical protein
MGGQKGLRPLYRDKGGASATGKSQWGERPYINS